MTDNIKPINLEHPMIQELLSRCDFPAAGSSVVCAVSGGADSAAMLILATAAGLDVTAIHVDHQLRDGSDQEAETVARLALAVGAKFEAKTVEVGQGSNLEARARDARFEVLPDGVMTGHTADDQAATVMLNMMRGTGSRGMSGMRPGYDKPILKLRREETVRLCETLGVDVVWDPSNKDPRYLRNRVRRELLPLMADIADRDIVPLLTRQADIAREEADLLDGLARRIDPTDAKALTAAPEVLARRALRRWLSAEHPPDAATIDRVMSVARGDILATQTWDGRRVSRSKWRLTIE